MATSSDHSGVIPQGFPRAKDAGDPFPPLDRSPSVIGRVIAGSARNPLITILLVIGLIEVMVWLSIWLLRK